jgi:hypothetical protein
LAFQRAESVREPLSTFTNDCGNLSASCGRDKGFLEILRRVYAMDQSGQTDIDAGTPSTQYLEGTKKMIPEGCPGMIHVPARSNE